ncbi:nucleotide cyclase [Chytridium lagenaria]|nr:nucleotide cyclase [Chytridium lagenaria]
MVAARKGQEHFSGGSDLIWKRLSLHVAVTAGQVTRVVVGVPSLRMDYYVEGDCFADLKDLLDKTKSGQLGISRCIFGMIPNISYPSSEESYCVLNDVQQKKLAADLLLEDIGNLSPFGNTYNIIRSSPLTKVPSQLLEGASLVGLKAMFMNQSLLYQIQGTNARGYKLSNIAPKSFEFRSEYRALSVFFVKLVQYAPPSEIQILLKALLYMLKRFRGVFQQCSVDDKGQTLLACFGLPPFAHERCAVVAAQGAMAFMNSLPTSLKSAVSIAIATGEVLFGTLGTTNRKEAGLLGDVFNIAARLLYIDRQPGCVAIDETTMQLIKDDFLCTSLGLFQIKGKSDVVEVWGIQAGMGQSALTRRGDRIGRDLIGNFGEWDCLKTEVNTWLLGGRERFVAIVEGISGMGKSSLLNCMQDYLLEEKTVFLIMRG